MIFGAGKTGRGFAAHLAFLGGYDIVLIDKNKHLVRELQKQGRYEVQILDAVEKSCTIPITRVYDIADPLWEDEVVATGLVFTAVFGNNLEDLSRDLAAALRKRYNLNPRALLTIITCENATNAANFLKENIIHNLSDAEQIWLEEVVGFSESIIFRTCLDATPDQNLLTIRSQNFFELPCDADGIKKEVHIHGLRPLKNFDNQLRRKIYTYNCINAVIAYLGAKKGYQQLPEAAQDEEILFTARKAAVESSDALVAEFGFDAKEQEEWMNAAFRKFSDKNMPDPIKRNAADPARKLGRDDRLIGPALLALKHDIYPEGLLEGIMACFDYKDPNISSSLDKLITENGIDFVLNKICGLSNDEQLFMLIKKEFSKRTVHGN